MDDQICFKYIDIILFSVGLKLFRTSSTIAILNYVIRLIAITDIYSNVASNAVQILVTDEAFDLYHYTYLISHLIMASIHHVIIIRTRSLKELLSSIFNMLTKREKRKLFRASNLLLASYAIITVFQLLSQFLYVYMMGYSGVVLDLTSIPAEEDNWYIVCLAIFKMFAFAIFNSNTFTVSAILYTFLVYSLHLIDESFSKRLSKANMNYATTIKARFKIDELRQQFNTLLSNLPFLWLSFLFILASGFVVITLDEDSVTSEPLYLLGEWLAYVGYSFAIIGSLLVCTYLSKQSASICRKLAYEISLCDIESYRQSRSTPISKRFLLKHLERKGYIKLSAWSVFKVSKELLLSFLGAIISFSILFAQIAIERKKSQLLPSNSTMNSTNVTLISSP